MTRHIISREHDLEKYDDLVEELRSELASPRLQEPFVIEERITATGSRHIHVIWKQWANVDHELRSRVIVQAYRALESDAADDITIAIGLTPHEAVEFGLLPFLVRDMRRNSDSVSFEDYQRLHREEAARTLLGPDAKDLRYPTLEAAEQASQRLHQQLPGSYWGVVEEVEQAG